MCQHTCFFCNLWLHIFLEMIPLKKFLLLLYYIFNFFQYILFILLKNRSTNSAIFLLENFPPQKEHPYWINSSSFSSKFSLYRQKYYLFLTSPIFESFSIIFSNIAFISSSVSVLSLLPNVSEYAKLFLPSSIPVPV